MPATQQAAAHDWNRERVDSQWKAQLNILQQLLISKKININGHVNIYTVDFPIQHYTSSNNNTMSCTIIIIILMAS